MTLTIEIKLNNRLIGGAIVTNESALAEISDYKVEAVETASTEAGHPTDFREVFPIIGHLRKKTVWALVEKVAQAARMRRENSLRGGS